jgi:hypothetical protein
MIPITVKYGLSGSITLDFNEDVAVSTVLQDERIKNALGLPERYVVLVNGAEISESDRLYGATTLRIEKQACTKGV